MTPDTLLALMFASYTLPIAFVYCKYRSATAGTRSISSIITSDEPFLSIMNNTPPPPFIARYRHYPRFKQDTFLLRVCS